MSPYTQPTFFDLPRGDVVSTPPLPPDTIILLDLNYTLVSNSWRKRKEPGPYHWQIGRETYHIWLIDLIKPYTVLLLTVRGQEYRPITLSHLQDLTGWQPHLAYFNPTSIYHGDVIKRSYLHDYILPSFGFDRPYLAIESYALARRMYQTEFSIPALPVAAVRKTGLPTPSRPTLLA